MSRWVCKDCGVDLFFSTPQYPDDCLCRTCRAKRRRADERLREGNELRNKAAFRSCSRCGTATDNLLKEQAPGVLCDACKGDDREVCRQRNEKDRLRREGEERAAAQRIRDLRTGRALPCKLCGGSGGTSWSRSGHQHVVCSRCNGTGAVYG